MRLASNCYIVSMLCSEFAWSQDWSSTGVSNVRSNYSSTKLFFFFKLFNQGNSISKLFFSCALYKYTIYLLHTNINTYTYIIQQFPAWLKTSVWNHALILPETIKAIINSYIACFLSPSSAQTDAGGRWLFIQSTFLFHSLTGSIRVSRSWRCEWRCKIYSLFSKDWRDPSHWVLISYL